MSSDATTEMTGEPRRADGEDTLTQPLVSGPTGDRCVSCGNPMSSDQRYCVVCGERRGKPRFELPVGGAGAAPTAELVSTAAAPPAPARTPRGSGGTTVVAGVGTLLLAMGVGVLIGRGSADSVNGKTVQAAAPATVVTVGGGTGAGTAGAASTTGKGSSKKSKGGKSKKQSASKPTAAQAAKASSAASKVLGSSAKNLPPATVTVGQSGHGPGYDKSGKFTGSFFGQ